MTPIHHPPAPPCAARPPERRPARALGRAAAALAAALALSACQTPPSTDPEQVGEFRKGSGYLKGYLASDKLPDSLALLPPPPAEGSPAHAADLAAHEAAMQQRNSLRWQVAADDNELQFPVAASTFSCALGLPITAERSPHLNMLLRRSLVDAGIATYKAKNRYNRPRPFVAQKAPICVPDEVPRLAKDGSYPSGHAALGWAWALLLAELAPDRADAVLARGHAFGQSRVACGVHWQSDVDAGRLVGAAAVARLHADPVFLAQMSAARGEIAALRAAGAKAEPALCRREAEALAR